MPPEPVLIAAMAVVLAVMFVFAVAMSAVCLLAVDSAWSRRACARVISRPPEAITLGSLASGLAGYVVTAAP